MLISFYFSPWKAVETLYLRSIALKFCVFNVAVNHMRFSFNLSFSWHLLNGNSSVMRRQITVADPGLLWLIDAIQKRQSGRSNLRIPKMAYMNHPTELREKSF